jgi:hypothetical protein
MGHLTSHQPITTCRQGQDHVVATVLRQQPYETGQPWNTPTFPGGCAGGFRFTLSALGLRSSQDATFILMNPHSDALGSLQTIVPVTSSVAGSITVILPSTHAT